MKKILVPSYFKNFRCKCGECRTCCCTGWGVTLSFKEYCSLLGLDCSKALRRRLDCAFFVLPDASPSRYAKMNQNYFGECPLRDADGLCALQKELGENALPEICKLYPRSILFDRLGEGACANSCESVLETMFASDDKLAFEYASVPDENTYKSLELDDTATKRDIQIQQNVINCLQERTLPFAERMIEAGKAVKRACGESGGACGGRDEPYAENTAEYAENSRQTENTVFKTEKTASFTENTVKHTDKTEKIDGVVAILDIMSELESFSDNFSRYALFAEKNVYAESTNAENDVDNHIALPSLCTIKAKYNEALKHFYAVLPNAEKYLEDVMVNHLVFERFPCTFDGESAWNEYAVLCGVEAVCFFAAVAYMSDKNSLDDFVDVTASLFRCIEHSNANKVILNQLKKMKMTDFDKLQTILRV